MFILSFIIHLLKTYEILVIKFFEIIKIMTWAAKVLAVDVHSTISTIT